MIPLIIVSNNEDLIEPYLNDFIAKNSFSQTHIINVRPLKKELTIDQMRSLKKEIMLGTVKKRLVIFHSFDNATLEAQNALLKTLEERNEDNQFVLIARNQERIIPTIRSRAKSIGLDKNDGSDFLIRPETYAFMDKLLNTDGYSSLADPLVASITRDPAEVLLEEMLVYCKRVLEPETRVAVLKKILITLSLLQNNNLNPQLAVDNVLIFIKKNGTLNG